MQIISFISGKGGVGKTTLSANIAVALAQRNKRVVIIDLDPQNAQRLHLGMDPDEIAGLIREGISSSSLFDSPFGIKFIPFGRVNETELEEFESQLELHRNWLLEGINSLSDSNFDFVIIDTPPGPTVYLQQAMQAAHKALVVVIADAASYATIPKTISLVEQYTADRLDFDGLNLLINQMPAQSKLGHQVRSALYANYADKLVPVAVYKLQYEPTSKASLDIQSVTDWLIDSIRQ
jgi:cellulose synthase operon protein YhjQ